MALCQTPSCHSAEPSPDFCVILGIPEMSSAVRICLSSIPGRDAIYLWVGFSHDVLNIPFNRIIRAAPSTQQIFLILQFAHCSTLYTVRYDQIPSANCPLSSSLTRAHSLLPTESSAYFHLFPPSLPFSFLQPSHFLSRSCASSHSCCVFMTTMVTAYTEALHSTTPNPPDPTDFPQPLLWYSLHTGGGDIDIPLGLSIQQPLIHRTFGHLWVPVLTAL